MNKVFMIAIAFLLVAPVANASSMLSCVIDPYQEGAEEQCQYIKDEKLRATWDARGMEYPDWFLDEAAEMDRQAALDALQEKYIALVMAIIAAAR